MNPSSQSSCRILFFSVLRDAIGAEEIDWPLSEAGTSVGELRRQMLEKFPALAKWENSLLVAVNLEFASPETVILPGSEVAIMPPVQGG